MEMNTFECKYCLHPFKRESTFKKHKCKLMKRYALARTPSGIVAFDDYTKWIGAKGYISHDLDMFVNSSFFVSFVKFAAFSKRIALPSKLKFIQYMASRNIYPKDWSSEIVYKHYIDQYESILTPDEQVAVTVDTVFELARIFECDSTEIFEHIEPSSLIQIVQAKKLSPWILLFSNTFLNFVNSDMNIEQRVMLGNIIDYKSWGKVFKQHPKMVAKMKKYVKALRL